MPKAPDHSEALARKFVAVGWVAEASDQVEQGEAVALVLIAETAEGTDLLAKVGLLINLSGRDSFPQNVAMPCINRDDL